LFVVLVESVVGVCSQFLGGSGVEGRLLENCSIRRYWRESFIDGEG